MKFRGGDELLAMCLVPQDTDPDVFVVFENGLAKRTPASDYPVKGRAGLGVRVAALSERGGDLVGALIVHETDEVMVVMEKGKLVRSPVEEIRPTGRNTMGVQFAKPDRGDSIVAVARNAESASQGELDEPDTDADPDSRAGSGDEVGAGIVGDETNRGPAVAGATADGGGETVSDRSESRSEHDGGVPSEVTSAHVEEVTSSQDGDETLSPRAD